MDRNRNLLEFVPLARYLSVAPGRVNLLGEHVDYNGGVVLPAAIDLNVRLAAEPLDSDIVTIMALDLGQEINFRLTDLARKVDVDGQPLPIWATYPAGVAWAAQQQGLPVQGILAAYKSNIPMGSGLSSSAAVEVAFGALWQEMLGWDIDHMQLALLCQRAENQYVGVNCGIMDQFASANGVKDHLLYFDTRSLEWSAVPLPAETIIVIADSGMRRSLTHSGYNDRRAACELSVELLQQDIPGMQTLRDITPDQFTQLAPKLPETARIRAQHVVEEIERVNQAVHCLQDGDAKCFGKLMLAGHESLRDLYEVSIPELDTLVDIAAQLPGCYGARLTGAGFGGCTVNLVAEDQAESFQEALKNQYFIRTGRQCKVYLCHASQGVTVERI